MLLNQADDTVSDDEEKYGFKGRLKVLIGPHSAHNLSGVAQAYTYKNLESQLAKYNFNRVVLLGPSHKFYMGDCICTTECQEWQTPFGNIKVDWDSVVKLVEDNL